MNTCINYSHPILTNHQSHEIFLTLDVVWHPHGDAGVVHGLCQPADVHLQVRATVRLALTVLRVALAVARIPALSFRASGSGRTWWSDDGTANIVTWRKTTHFVITAAAKHMTAPVETYCSDTPGSQCGCCPEGSSHCRSPCRSSCHLVDPVALVGLEDQGDLVGL